MEDKRMQRAHELIREGEYAAARAILVTVNTPRAREWIAGIDARMPRPIHTDTSQLDSHVAPKRRRWIYALIGIGVLIVVGAALPKANGPVGGTGRTTSVPTRGPISTSTQVYTRVAPTVASAPTLPATDAPTPNASTTPIILSYAGTGDEVFGPVEIPAGLYRAVFTSTGFGAVKVRVIEGKCSGGIFGELLFNEVRGHADEGSEAIFESDGCRALIEVSNTTEPYTLDFAEVQR